MKMTMKKKRMISKKVCENNQNNLYFFIEEDLNDDPNFDLDAYLKVRD